MQKRKLQMIKIQKRKDLEVAKQSGVSTVYKDQVMDRDEAVMENKSENKIEDLPADNPEDDIMMRLFGPESDRDKTVVSELSQAQHLAITALGYQSRPSSYHSFWLLKPPSKLSQLLAIDA